MIILLHMMSIVSLAAVPVWASPHVSSSPLLFEAPCLLIQPQWAIVLIIFILIIIIMVIIRLRCSQLLHWRRDLSHLSSAQLQLALPAGDLHDDFMMIFITIFMMDIVIILMSFHRFLCWKIKYNDFFEGWLQWWPTCIADSRSPVVVLRLQALWAPRY